MTAPASIRTLRRYLPGRRLERCELCGVEVPKKHGHLLDVKTRRLSCACEPCSVLFLHRGASTYRRVGRTVRRLADFLMTDADWESLRIPIGLAFFVNCSAEGRVMAFYPGPAGPTESLLALASWGQVAARNPELAAMEADVEALLVNRVGAVRDHYLVPIDRCYELAGLIRMHWRGLSGGDEVWREIGAFFDLLREAGGA
jgi:Family of unknown function (DUF5947)